MRKIEKVGIMRWRGGLKFGDFDLYLGDGCWLGDQIGEALSEKKVKVTIEVFEVGE